MFTSEPASTRNAVEPLVQLAHALDLPQQLVRPARRCRSRARRSGRSPPGTRSRASARAAAMSSSELRPSESVVWQCRSPRRSASVTSCGQRASSAASQLAAALAQLRLDVGQAEHLVHAPPRSGSGAPCPSRPPRRRTRSRACPRRTAYSRSSTLCCLEPVRCWSTLPNWSGSTTRKSIRSPLWVTPRAPASPLDTDRRRAAPSP